MNQQPIDLQAALSHHGPMLARVARALVRDEHFAQDLVQETWAQAAAAAPAQRPSSAPGDVDGLRGWLITTMRNLARSGVRRQAVRGHAAQRTKDELGPEDLEAKSAAETAERLETMRTVHSVLTSLEEPLRSTLRLRFDEGLSSSEIAARMGVASSTVRSRIGKGLGIMKERLDAEFGGSEDGRRAWCAALVPLTKLRPDAAVAPGAKALAAWKIAAAVVVLGGGTLGVQGLLGAGSHGATTGALQPIEPPALAEASTAAPTLDIQEAGRAVAGPSAPGAGVPSAAPTPPPMGLHLVVVNPDGVAQANFPMGVDSSSPRDRGRLSPEAGYRTDAYGRLPILQGDSDQPIARFVFANAPLVPLVSIELDDDALGQARLAPLTLEVPYTASLGVELLDATGTPWDKQARLRLRPTREHNVGGPGDLVSWIDFKGSQARFAHVGTERPCELIADQLGEWKTLTDHLPGLSPGEARKHTFRVVDQRIILVGEVVDVRGHALPSIRLMARETAMWSHTAEASPEGRIRLPLIQAEGSGEVELLGISTDGASWDLVGSIQVPEHVSSGEYDFGKVVMEPKVTVAGTFRTSSGLPVVHSFVNVVQQADSGLWERAEMSVMAGEGGQFTTTRDVEDDSMPLAFYQFEPISTAEGRHLIETPVPFARGARNVEVVLTPAVHLKGSVEIPEGVRARDVRIALVREGCPTRTIRGVQRDGSFESWQPQGTFDVEVRVSRPSDPLVRISNVVLRPGDEAPAVLQGIRQAR